MTVGELIELLCAAGADEIASAIRRAKTPRGARRFLPHDPIEGPYFSDGADAEVLRIELRALAAADLSTAERRRRLAEIEPGWWSCTGWWEP